MLFLLFSLYSLAAKNPLFSCVTYYGNIFQYITLSFVEVRVCVAPNMYFPLRAFIFEYCLLSSHFIIDTNFTRAIKLKFI